MASQNSGDLTTQPFIRGGDARTKTATYAQDGGRSGAVAEYTLLSKILATGLYTTFTDPTATDGSQWPCAISRYSITEAAVKAGNVTSYEIFYLDTQFDAAQLTIENSKTLATEITSPTGIDMTVQDWLELQGILPLSVTDIDGYENA